MVPVSVLALDVVGTVLMRVACRISKKMQANVPLMVVTIHSYVLKEQEVHLKAGILFTTCRPLSHARLLRVEC